ncbi:unnamed protein product, partial [marine sediment metagenome]
MQKRLGKRYDVLIGIDDSSFAKQHPNQTELRS